ncbi:MAG: TldD/PmbA family protein [Candidatus Methanomethylicia archaeon]
MDDLLLKLINSSLSKGASYAEARGHVVNGFTITVENNVLRGVEYRSIRGIGLRVIVDGVWGFSSSTMLKNTDSIVDHALSIARASKSISKPINLIDVKPVHGYFSTITKINPFNTPIDEFISLAIDVNKHSRIDNNIKTVITKLGVLRDCRVFTSSNNSLIVNELTIVGLGHSSTAHGSLGYESVWDSRSCCMGYEFIKGFDWYGFVENISETALKASNSSYPKAGVYTIIADPDLVGLILHEAFGHASEADLVASGESVLQGRIGEYIASKYVTIVDDGLIADGFNVPVDDEGVVKRKTVVVDKGVLRGFLTSRETAAELNIEPTGNARAESFSQIPIVRQTNYYMEKGDYSFEELIEDVDFGLYVKGCGAGGGQVNVGIGSFTFNTGPSYIIRNGEVSEMVRGVILSGYILDTLKSIDAVGKDFSIRTSIFGGCGKDNQTVKVGHGGPHVRIRSIVVGGR